MNQDNMHLINKLFNNDTIRTVWDKEEEKYYISVVDIVTVITKSKDGRKYWNKLKQRLKEEGNESVTNCHQLKLKALDGKYYNTDVWKSSGITYDYEYAMLTNEIYKTWSGMKVNEYKAFKGIRKESLRDNMTDIEVLLTDLGEIATRDIAETNHPKGLKENMKVARKGGKVASDARKSYEKATNKKAISNKNVLSYQYIQENKQIENK